MTLTESPAKDCRGRWVSVLMHNELYVGTVIDADPENPDRPKRVRIQRGPLQGNELMPGQYAFKSFLEEEQIDP